MGESFAPARSLLLSDVGLFLQQPMTSPPAEVTCLVVWKGVDLLESAQRWLWLS